MSINSSSTDSSHMERVRRTAASACTKLQHMGNPRCRETLSKLVEYLNRLEAEDFDAVKLQDAEEQAAKDAARRRKRKNPAPPSSPLTDEEKLRSLRDFKKQRVHLAKSPVSESVKPQSPLSD